MIALLALVPEAKGILRWEKYYGTQSDERGINAEPTADGGYIVLGTTGGSADVWLIKTDSLGDTLWTRLYRPGGVYTFPSQLAVTADDGYAIVATTDNSPGGTYVLKTDRRGDSLWAHTYGVDTTGGYGDGIVPLPDSGFLALGTKVMGGWGYVFAARVDCLGETLWTRTYASRHGSPVSAKQCSDGGFIIAGRTMLDSYEIQGLLIRIDSLGDSLWLQNYGGRNRDVFSAVCCTRDSGFLAVGTTESYGAGAKDIWVVKVDRQGRQQWRRTYGGADWDDAFDMCPATDSGFVIAGATFSFGMGYDDGYVVKITPSGEPVWSRTFGGPGYDYVGSVRSTTDGGYIFTGNCGSFGHGNGDVWLIKTDELGLVALEEQPTALPHAYPARLRIESAGILDDSRTIRYFVPRPNPTFLTLFDATGRKTAPVIRGEIRSGWQETRLPDELPTGTYFVLLSSGGQSVSQSVVIIKH